MLAAERDGTTRDAFDVNVVLDEFVSFLRRFVVLCEAQADAIALWVLHTHCVEAAVATPYLAITSAEKRSGKSRLLEVLALLVARPLRAGGATEAALFRSLALEPPPTLLMDEVDALFGLKANGNHEDIRALLNAGHRRGTPVLRCVGERGQRVEAFPVFGPKALAGIGVLPDTLADRSLPVRLKRRAATERVERLRERDVAPEAEGLRGKANEFAAANVEALHVARPELPDELDDRAQDACEPLAAIADCVGGSWPARARAALVALRGGEGEPEEASLGVRLLADVRLVFADHGATQLASAELIAGLAALEEAPWGDFRGGGPLGARRLSTLLRPYGIRPRDLRIGEKSLKGYRHQDFADAFARYLPRPPGAAPGVLIRDVGDSAATIADHGDSAAATTAALSRNEDRAFPQNDALVADVAAAVRSKGEESAEAPQ